jgi:AP-1 complex subunit gamma-1
VLNLQYCFLTVSTTFPQSGNYVREEILSAFIRLMVHTPELQAYTASKLYNALRADISQEALTLSATWILGEYSEILIEGGLVDEEQTILVWAGDYAFDCF